MGCSGRDSVAEKIELHSFRHILVVRHIRMLRVLPKSKTGRIRRSEHGKSWYGSAQVVSLFERVE
jgi:hypothetical protein